MPPLQGVASHNVTLQINGAEHVLELVRRSSKLALVDQEDGVEIARPRVVGVVLELVADFLLLRIVGKGPMDRAKCIDYWGSDVDACREFK